MTRLGDLAFARTGDKGDDSIVGVYCLSQDEYNASAELLSIGRIADHFGINANQVKVHPLPDLLAFTVVLAGVLDGGVTRSLRTDPHGKTLGSYLLELAS